MSSTEEQRLAVCKSLGLSSLAQAHELIMSGLKKGTGAMMQRGLNAAALVRLGYTAMALQKMGFTPQALQALGFKAAAEAGAAGAGVAGAAKKPSVALPPDAAASGADKTLLDQLRPLLAAGKRASELRSAGFTINDLKRAGMSASDLRDLGFSLDELAPHCTAAEMGRAQFNVRELRRFFDGHELKRAGFSATDMRMAGFTVRELMNIGYNENHIKTAGYSTADLVREGLTRTTQAPH